MVEPLSHYRDTGNLRQAIADTLDLLEGLDAKVALQEQKQQQAAAAAAAAAGGGGPLQGGMGSPGGMAMQQVQQPGLQRLRNSTAAMQQLQEMQQEQMVQQQGMPQQQQQQGAGGLQQQAWDATGMPPASPDAELLGPLLGETQSTPAKLNSPMLQQQRKQGGFGMQGNSMARSVSADTPTQLQHSQQAAKRKNRQQQQPQSTNKKQATAAGAEAEAGMPNLNFDEDVYDPPGGFEGVSDLSLPVQDVVPKAAFMLKSLIILKCDPGHEEKVKPPYYLDQVSDMRPE
jgi:hypothetical protein